MKPPSRRQILRTSIAGATFLPAAGWTQDDREGWRSLFDGRSLEGWKAVPRLGSHRLFREAKAEIPRDRIVERLEQWHRDNGTPQATFDHVGEWKVEEGAIVGGQTPAGSGLGAYLMTEATFGDFELEYEIRPDWRCDTGVLMRQHEVGTIGFQVLCDHRPNGGIGGIYTNSLGSYIAAPFVVDGDVGENFNVENFRRGEPDLRFKQGKLADATTWEAFREVWRVNDWNRFPRSLCRGESVHHGLDQRAEDRHPRQFTAGHRELRPGHHPATRRHQWSHRPGGAQQPPAGQARPVGPGRGDALAGVENSRDCERRRCSLSDPLAAWRAGSQIISSPRIVPVLVAKASASTPRRCKHAHEQSSGVDSRGCHRELEVTRCGGTRLRP